MAGFQLQRHVAAPLDTVFDLYSDFAAAPERVSGIVRLELLTDGPLGVGTRFRETRIMFGKEATEELEITAFDPPRSYCLACAAHGTLTTSEFRFTPTGGGTDVTVDLQVKPTTMAAKLFAPIAGLFMGTLRKCIERDMDDLDKHLPGHTVSSGA